MAVLHSQKYDKNIYLNSSRIPTETKSSQEWNIVALYIKPPKQIKYMYKENKQ